MKHVNQVITQTGNGRQQTEQCEKSRKWSLETEKLVLGLFARLASLFGNKCKSQGLEIHDQDNKYTNVFRDWCLKLDRAGLVAEDYKRGIERIEMLVRDAARAENDIWPPSYAQFIGHALAATERAALREYNRLPRSKLTKEERREKLNKLRQEVGL